MSGELFAFLLTVLGAGTAVFALIEFLDMVLPVAYRLSSDDKYALAVVFSFVFPVGAYIGQRTAMGVQPTLDGVLGAFAVGYAVSKTLHDEFEKRGWELDKMRRPDHVADTSEQ